MYKVKIYIHSSVKENVSDDIAKVIPYFQSPFVKAIIPNGITLTIATAPTTIPKQDFPMKLVVPDNNYNFFVYLFEKGAFPMTTGNQGYTQTIYNKQASMIYTDNFSDSTDYIWKCIVHELLHAITYDLLAKNKITFDNSWNLLDLPMWGTSITPYYGNSNPYLIGGNYQQQLIKIAPLFNMPAIPAVNITRQQSTAKETLETLGTLTATNGGAIFTCKTLELVWANNAPNISCIPTGTYTVKWTFSPRLLKFTYEVQNVPKRSGIRFHSANYFSDLLGCIGLGNGLSDLNKDGQLDIINSRITISAFEGFMGKKDFQLTII